MYQFYNRNYKMNVCVYQNNLFTKYISMFSDVNEGISKFWIDIYLLTTISCKKKAIESA